MKLERHSARDFADALAAVLPPGKAWEWPRDGFGDGMVLATAQELARVEDGAQTVLDAAIDLHRPVDSGGWHISQYRRTALDALGNVAEAMPRKPCAIGSKIGVRLWSHAAPDITAAIPLLQIDHLLGPARIGSKIGDALWTAAGRYVIRVRYYRSVVDPAAIWKALNEFKQAHAYLYFEDITGVGGFYAPC